MNKILKEIVSWVITILVAVLFAVIINRYIIVNAKVPSGSMENTIMTNDRAIANRLSYKFSEPKRGDIIVFKFPDDESILFVKRIAGLPGETVTIINGKVYIDGSSIPLEEPYLKEVPNTGVTETFIVPEGHYFMLGDNRNFSKDSRYWNNKYVAYEKIQGKILFKYYPGFKFIK